MILSRTIRRRFYSCVHWKEKVTFSNGLDFVIEENLNDCVIFPKSRQTKRNNISKGAPAPDYNVFKRYINKHVEYYLDHYRNSKILRKNLLQWISYSEYPYYLIPNRRHGLIERVGDIFIMSGGRFSCGSMYWLDEYGMIRLYEDSMTGKLQHTAEFTFKFKNTSLAFSTDKIAIKVSNMKNPPSPRYLFFQMVECSEEHAHLYLSKHDTRYTSPFVYNGSYERNKLIFLNKPAHPIIRETLCELVDKNFTSLPIFYNRIPMSREMEIKSVDKLSVRHFPSDRSGTVFFRLKFERQDT